MSGSERITKTQRWLDLIAYLVGRRLPVEVDAIMEAVPAYAEKYGSEDANTRETVRRMFERDKDELRGLGIPIETVPYTLHYGAEQAQGYRLKTSDFYLPYLRLLADQETGGRPPPPARRQGVGTVELRASEASMARGALLQVYDLPSFPLRTEARSALRKLSFDLGPAPDAGSGSRVLYVDRPGAEEIRDRVRVLSDALLARKRVRFTYHGIHRGEATARDVAPYGLLFQRGHWYLVGHDATRAAIRIFRVGRMEEPEVNASSPRTPDYAIPDDFSLEGYRSREAWELGSDDDGWVTARLVFAFPVSLWADRNGYGTRVEEHADGSSVREFRVFQTGPFLRWVLSLEGEAKLVEPPELGRELASLAREVLAVYGAGARRDREAASGAESDG